MWKWSFDWPVWPPPWGFVNQYIYADLCNDFTITCVGHQPLKHIVGKSQTDATNNVTMHPHRQAIWGHIWKPIYADLCNDSTITYMCGSSTYAAGPKSGHNLGLISRVGGCEIVQNCRLVRGLLGSKNWRLDDLGPNWDSRNQASLLVWIEIPEINLGRLRALPQEHPWVGGEIWGATY